MATLQVATTFVQRNDLRHLHNTWSNCPSLVSLDRHGAELKPALTVNGVARVAAWCSSGRRVFVRIQEPDRERRLRVVGGDERRGDSQPSREQPRRAGSLFRRARQRQPWTRMYEYLPLMVPFRMTMGTEPLNMQDWIEIDIRFPFCALPEFSSVMRSCEGEPDGAATARSAEVVCG